MSGLLLAHVKTHTFFHESIANSISYCGSASLGFGSVFFLFFFNIATRDQDLAITSSR